MCNGICHHRVRKINHIPSYLRFGKFLVRLFHVQLNTCRRCNQQSILLTNVTIRSAITVMKLAMSLETARKISSTASATPPQRVLAFSPRQNRRVHLHQDASLLLLQILLTPPLDDSSLQCKTGPQRSSLRNAPSSSHCKPAPVLPLPNIGHRPTFLKRLLSGKRLTAVSGKESFLPMESSHPPPDADDMDLRNKP